MQLSHTRPVKSAVFDDRNLVSSAGLVPAVRLATLAGLAVLADRHLSVPADKGANAGGGPKGVGDAVNESVVITFLLLFIVNLIISAIYLQLVPPKTG